MVNIYIDAPCFSMGGVEFFSIYTALSLYKKGHNVFLIESVNHRNIPKDALEEMHQKVPTINTEELLVLLKSNQHDNNVIVMSWNSKLYEVLYDHLIHTKDNVEIIGYSHNAAVYYYDPLKLYAPMISKFICVSETIQEELLNVIPERKADIYYHPCPTTINNRKTFENVSEEISILFVGRIEDASKGVFRLIEICDELIKHNVKFKLRIVGKGVDLDVLKTRFKQKFGEEEGMYEFIENAHTPKEVFQYMKLSDILVVTSNFEGGPIVVYEAMACMVVPVSFNVGNVSSIIRNGENGFMTNVGNTKALVDTIVYLYQHPHKKRMIAEEAYRNIVKQGYLQDTFDKFLIDLCNNIFKNKFLKNLKHVAENIHIRKNYLNSWIFKIIPNNIDKQYQFSTFLNETRKLEKEKQEVHFNKILFEKENEINYLKKEVDSLKKKLLAPI